MNSLSVIKTHACHLCDRSFVKKYNLRRHIESVHSEEQSTDSEESNSMEYSAQSHQYEPSYKMRRVRGSHDHDDDESSEEEDLESDKEVEDTDESADEEEGASSDLEDNSTYQDWLEEAKETNEEMWNSKYEKYINEGLSEHHAKEKANTKTLCTVRRNFFARFKDFLSGYLHLKDDKTCHKVLDDLEEKIEKGVDINKALNRVIAKHESKFAGLFVEDNESDDEEEENEDEELQ